MKKILFLLILFTSFYILIACNKEDTPQGPVSTLAITNRIPIMIVEYIDVWDCAMVHKDIVETITNFSWTNYYSNESVELNKIQSISVQKKDISLAPIALKLLYRSFYNDGQVLIISGKEKVTTEPNGIASISIE